MLVVAFYTKDTPYEQEIKVLEASLKARNLKYHFEGFPSRGSWELNCGIKPVFLLGMYHRYTDDLLYVDADAVVEKDLDFSDCDDIGIHRMKDGTLLSGTLLLRHTNLTEKLLNLWVQEQEKYQTTWDQVTLDNVVKRNNIPFTQLPSTYVKVFDKPWGDAVITHNQASRRFKKIVREEGMVGIPDVVENQRVRKMQDGTFVIARNHKKAVTYLDTHFTRIPGELRWCSKAINTLELDDLAKVFKGKNCYVVGKGPSLDNLIASDFKDNSPILAINEAIHAVEKLGLKNPTFCVQQDMDLRDGCQPSKGMMIVSTSAQHWYDGDKYVYSPSKLGLGNSSLSVLCAVTIARKYGAIGFKMLCFDAAVNKNTEYAKVIGHTPHRGGNPDRFLKHKARILKQAGDLPVTWIIPELVTPKKSQSQDQDTCDKSLSTQEHQQGQSEHDHVEHPSLKQHTQEPTSE